MPEEIEIWLSVERRAEVARHARNVFYALIIACGLSFLTIWALQRIRTAATLEFEVDLVKKLKSGK